MRSLIPSERESATVLDKIGLRLTPQVSGLRNSRREVAASGAHVADDRLAVFDARGDMFLQRRERSRAFGGRRGLDHALVVPLVELEHLAAGPD